MAHGHLIISKETFRGYVLSDALSQFLGLPLELPESDAEDAAMVKQSWTFYKGFFDYGIKWSAGSPFAVTEDEDGVPTRTDGNGEETDWVVPINAQVFELTTLIAGLAQAKGVPIHVVLLRAADTAKYLKDGSQPSLIV